MNISALGEFGLIDRIQKISSRKNPSVLIGIGDDAAAIKSSAGQVTLVTTDLLLEGIHFDLHYTDYYSLGWKSAAVNLSDIAAMGAQPTCCLTALGIPRTVSAEQVLDFYRGFNALLRARDTALAGGDTCASQKELFVSVTALGRSEQRRILARSGARPGDRIFVTGTLGDSAAGLEILKRGIAKIVAGARANNKLLKKTKVGIPESGIAALVRRHLRPVPRNWEGRMIAVSGCASAMIDISDGLSSDLFHICRESGAGAEIVEALIPISRGLRSYAAAIGKEPLDYALSGGEDYELLFTVPETRLKKFASLRLPATEIGIVTRKSGILRVDPDGTRRELEPSGYDHFARTGKSVKTVRSPKN